MSETDKKKKTDDLDIKAAPFYEKLSELLIFAENNENFLAEQEVVDFFNNIDLSQADMKLIFDYLEKHHVEIWRPENYRDDILLDNEGDEIDVAVEKIDLLVLENDNPDDSVRIYLKEIGRLPLLTPEEEIELAQSIEIGNVAAEQVEQMEASMKETLVNGKTMGEEQMKELVALIEEGTAAKKRMTEANLRLVVSIAKHYEGNGVLFSDLIQEGNEALIKQAVENFDYHKGYKFATYATQCIRGAIKRAIAKQARTIRMPEYMVENIAKLNRVSQQFQQEFGREPTLEETAERMNISEKAAYQILKFSHSEMDSLDTPIDEDEEGYGLIDRIEYDDKVGEEGEAGDFVYSNMQDPEAVILDKVMDETKEKIFSEALTEWEQNVFRLRAGKKGEYGSGLSVEKIAEMYRKDPEDIRQIEENANRKLFADDNIKQIQEEASGRMSVYLSGPMEAAASMITPGNLVADLGCDHAYIPIVLCNEWILTGGKRGASSFIVMETSEGELEKTKRLIVAYGKSDRIETRLSGFTDGLEKLGEDEAETILISGMGAKSIKMILTKHMIPPSVKELVLQTEQTDDVSELRSCIRECGFLIEKEILTKEDEKFYLVIKAVREAGANATSQGQCTLEVAGKCQVDIRETVTQEMMDAFGPLLLIKKDPTLHLWLKQELHTTERKLEHWKEAPLESENLKARYNVLSHRKELVEVALDLFNTTKTTDNL